MRIIIKQCRFGTRLLQSAQLQKQEGQRHRVRKAALLNALLDLISFGHLKHQAMSCVIVDFHVHVTQFATVVYLLLKSFLDFTAALNHFSQVLKKHEVFVNSLNTEPEIHLRLFVHFSIPSK